jgi:hypothetical protein
VTVNVECREPELVEAFVSRIALESGIARDVVHHAVADEVRRGRIAVDEHGRIIGLTPQARRELAGPLAGLNACAPGDFRDVLRS